MRIKNQRATVGCPNCRTECDIEHGYRARKILKPLVWLLKLGLEIIASPAIGTRWRVGR